jgi:hypothetical protein
VRWDSFKRRSHERIEEVLDDLDLALPARRLADYGLTAWAEVLARVRGGWWLRIRSHPTSAGAR